MSTATDPLALLRERVGVLPRRARASETLYDIGTRFGTLFAVTTGVLKITRPCFDGRKRVASLSVAPDWLGFDGIASGHHRWQATALTDCELASVAYDDVLRASQTAPALIHQMHAEMARQITQQRQMATLWRRLAVNPRVARFLLDWIERTHPGAWTDGASVTLPLPRAEIAELLGMTVESVSRALSQLSREGIISFSDAARRCLQVTNLQALRAFASAPAAGHSMPPVLEVPALAGPARPR